MELVKYLTQLVHLKAQIHFLFSLALKWSSDAFSSKIAHYTCAVEKKLTNSYAVHLLWIVN
jgi:hypothetical protein